MRICRFDGDRIGFVESDHVLDITDLAVECGVGPPKLLDGDPLVSALPALRARLSNGGAKFSRKPLSAIRLENPVRFPTKIIGAGSNYARHKAEMAERRDMSHTSYDLARNGVFLKSNSSLVGPSDGVAIRFLEKETQHEVELVAVIGRKASNVSEDKALDYVAAYSVGLDITMRGDMERSLRKSFDTYTVLGPWLTTSDELSDPTDVRLTLSVNQQPRQDESTSGMTVGIAGLVAYASQYYTLFPGDLIYSGTPSGTGPIRPGDVIKAGADKIGEMIVAVRAFFDA